MVYASSSSGTVLAMNRGASTAPEPGLNEGDAPTGRAGDHRQVHGHAETHGGSGAETEVPGGPGEAHLPGHGGEGPHPAGVREAASSLQPFGKE